MASSRTVASPTLLVAGELLGRQTHRHESDCVEGLSMICLYR